MKRLFLLLGMAFFGTTGIAQHNYVVSDVNEATLGSHNTLVGASAIPSAGAPENWANGFIGDYNVAFGHRAMRYNQDGNENTAVGAAAMDNIRDGDGNTAVGRKALLANQQGGNNTAIGLSALLNCSGGGNVAVGASAGSAAGFVSNNTIVGMTAGSSIAVGSRNVLLGFGAGPSTGSVYNDRLYINNGVNNNPLIFGDFSTRNLTFNTDMSGSRVKIQSNASGISGLTFPNLTSALTPASNSTDGVLSVNTAGDVIWVTDKSIYTYDGTLDTSNASNTATIGTRTVTMDGSNLFFDRTGSDDSNGKIYIGTVPSYPITTGDYNLYVEGGILTEKVKVAARFTGSNWADYVFADDYKLMPLSEVEAFVKENKHLPGVASAEELSRTGLDLGAMQAKQMEKIEELTLHLIEQNKTIEKQSSEIEELKTQVKLLLEKK